jgi:hypothetical protein
VDSTTEVVEFGFGIKRGDVVELCDRPKQCPDAKLVALVPWATFYEMRELLRVALPVVESKTQDLWDICRHGVLPPEDEYVTRIAANEWDEVIDRITDVLEKTGA